jgi:hypothetical protein
MIIIDKIFDKVFILYNPQRENVAVGENLLLHEPNLPIEPNSVIAQVIEEKPYIPAAMKESLLLESLAPEVEASTGIEELNAARSELRNQKMAVAKIRLSAHVKHDRIERVMFWNGWSPTPGCQVKKLDDEKILQHIDLQGQSGNVAEIGKTKAGSPYNLNLFFLHGVSAILGGRGTGKSHLAKLLALKLASAGVKVIVFDINDEWSAMQKNLDGTPSKYANRIIKKDPGENVRFTLKYLGKNTFASVLRIMKMEETTPSAQNALKIWMELDRKGQLSLENMMAKIQALTIESVKEALLTRLNNLANLGIISRDVQGDTVESLLNQKEVKDGGLIVVNLKEKPAITQFIVIQLFISKLASILSRSETEPLVLILEEAQTYMAHSDLEEIVTRLRHLGLHQVYITNNPRSLQSFLLSHITNWFVFNLANEEDIQYLQSSLPLDIESATTFIRMLPPRNALILINEMYQGKSKNYPFIVQVEPLPLQTAGTTRELFEKP